MNDPERTTDPLNIIVGIPTFRRPSGLARLLESLVALEGTKPKEIIVAENDNEFRHGFQVVDNLIRERYPYKLKCILVPQRGISQARNALLHAAFKEAGADFLAMVDDDETADGSWLTELLEQQAETGADVVGGRIVSEFPDGKPGWAEDLPVYRSKQPDSGTVELIDCTANVLIHARIYRELNQKFDVGYSLSGGGDKEYFVRVKKMGAQFAFASKAITFETFNKDRTTRWWALKRAFRIGAGDTRIHLRHQRGFINHAREIVKIPMAIFVALVTMPLYLLASQRRFMASLVLLSRQFGKLYGIAGLKVTAYGAPDGK